MRKLICLLLSAVLFACSSSATGASDFFDDYEAIDRTAKSVLYIKTDDDFDPEVYTTGSGFVAFNNQTFVTNYHVIDDAVSIQAYDEDGRKYAVGRIIAVDEKRDIAILSFKSPTNLKPLALAANPSLMRGKPVAAIGSPEGYVNSYSLGTISAIYTEGGKTEIQFTASISHGSSGGALLNEMGEVIGITYATAEEGQNINFAVHIQHAIDLYLQEFPNYAPGGSNLPTANARAFRQLSVLDEGKEVLELQKRLKELGYYPHMITRVYDTNTFDAVRLFQEVNGLQATGVASVLMQEALFGASAVPNPPPAPTAMPELSKPTDVKASLSNTTVTLSWTAVKGAAAYIIFRATYQSGYYIVIGTTKTTQYSDIYATRGYTYYYQIQAIAQNSTSEKSSTVKIVMPSPTASTYVEPKYPLKLGDTGRHGTIADPYINPQIVSVSGKKTVDGFTLTYKCQDIDQEYLTFDGSDVIYSEYAYTVTIRPGEAVFPGKVSMRLYDGTVKYIHIAITKIHTTDGKTYDIPESEWDFWYWTLD